jgi:hypothetical protein
MPTLLGNAPPYHKSPKNRGRPSEFRVPRAASRAVRTDAKRSGVLQKDAAVCHARSLLAEQPPPYR